MAKIFAATSDKIEQREIDHAEISRKLATECVVLLENNGVLPLAGVTKVALFGTGARNTIKGGTGSGEVNTRTVVSIEKGLENTGITITSKAWLDSQDTHSKKAYAEYMRRLKRRTPKRLQSYLTTHLRSRQHMP
jgi:beta-glucosidase